MTRGELGRDIVVLACAISAGMHGALAPDHFADGAGAGIGFVVAALLLAALAAVVTLRPTSEAALAGSAAVFAGLLVSYAAATTTGLPVLHPEPEPVEGLAVTTKAVELLGLSAALGLLRRPAAVAPNPNPKGT